MSAVTMCDLCGLTSRVQSEMRKLRVPDTAVPPGLPSPGGNEAALDVCAGCVEALQGALGELVTLRRGGPLDPAPPATIGMVEAWPCDVRGHRYVRPNGAPSKGCVECDEEEDA